MKILGGYLPATAGRVLLNGEPAHFARSAGGRGRRRGAHPSGTQPGRGSQRRGQHLPRPGASSRAVPRRACDAPGGGHPLAARRPRDRAHHPGAGAHRRPEATPGDRQGAGSPGAAADHGRAHRQPHPFRGGAAVRAHPRPQRPRRHHPLHQPQARRGRGAGASGHRPARREVRHHGRGAARPRASSSPTSWSVARSPPCSRRSALRTRGTWCGASRAWASPDGRRTSASNSGAARSWASPGLVGAGRTELFEGILGLRPRIGGRFELEGRPLAPAAPRRRGRRRDRLPERGPQGQGAAHDACGSRPT